MSGYEYLLAPAKFGIRLTWSLGGKLFELSYKKAEAYSLCGRTVVGRLMQDHPLDDARIGVKAIEKGKKLDDPALQFTGEALVAKALVVSDHDPNVPSEITDEIAHMAAEEGIDPVLSPLLNDETAAEAEGLLAPGSNVTELYPGAN